MSAGRVKFCPVVECGAFFTEHEVIFLSQAKSALFGGGIIGLGSVQDLPVHAIVYTLVLQFPNMVAQLSPIGRFCSRLGFVLEGGFMNIESGLPVCGSQSCVSLNLTTDNLGDSGLVNCVSGETLSAQWT